MRQTWCVAFVFVFCTKVGVEANTQSNLPIANFRVTNSTSTGLNLAWDAPFAGAQYTLQSAVNSGAFSTLIASQNTTSVSIISLSLSNVYNFVVATTTGNFSATLSVQPTASIPSSTVSNVYVQDLFLYASNATVAQTQLMWEAVWTATMYKVSVKPVADSSCNSKCGKSTTALFYVQQSVYPNSVTVSSVMLSPIDRLFQITVTPVNTHGEGSGTSVFVKPINTIPPYSPRAFARLTNVLNTSVTIQFFHPSATSYHVVECSSAHTPSTCNTTAPTTTATNGTISATISFLTASTTYIYRVLAVNQFGIQNVADAPEVSVMPSGSAPTASSKAPIIRLSVESLSRNHVTIRWLAQSSHTIFTLESSLTSSASLTPYTIDNINQDLLSPGNLIDEPDDLESSSYHSNQNSIVIHNTTTTITSPTAISANATLVLLATVVNVTCLYPSSIPSWCQYTFTTDSGSLVVEKEHTICVQAGNNHGMSNIRDCVVVNLSQRVPSEICAIWRWDVQRNQSSVWVTHPMATWFRVFANFGNGVWKTVADRMSSRHITIPVPSDLTENATVVVRVVPANTYGFGKECSFTLALTSQAPLTRVSNLRVETTNTTKATITWDDSPFATSFQVKNLKTGSILANYLYTNHLEVNETSAVICQVISRNRFGLSPASNVTALLTSAKPKSRISNLYLADVSHDTITLVFLRPSDATRVAIALRDATRTGQVSTLVVPSSKMDDYPSDDWLWVPSKTEMGTGDNPSVTITGLLEGKIYEIILLAANNHGRVTDNWYGGMCPFVHFPAQIETNPTQTSNCTMVILATPTRNIPDAIGQLRVSKLIASSSATIALTIQWHAALSATYYQIWMKSLSSGTFARLDASSTSGSVRAFANGLGQYNIDPSVLAVNQSYEIQVRAGNSFGIQNETSVVSVRATIASILQGALAVSSIRINYAYPQNVSLTWASDYRAFYHVVEARSISTNATNWTVVSFEYRDTQYPNVTCVFAGLNVHEHFEVRVRGASTEGIEGHHNSLVTGIQVPVAGQLPPAISQLSVALMTESSVSVSWDAVPLAYKYKVVLRTEASNASVVVMDDLRFTDSTTSKNNLGTGMAKISGLNANDGLHRITVYAGNSYGWEASGSLYEVTLSSSKPPLTTRVWTNIVECDSVALEWDKVDTALWYGVDAAIANTSDAIQNPKFVEWIPSTVLTSAVVAPLLPGATYIFRVRSGNTATVSTDTDGFVTDVVQLPSRITEVSLVGGSFVVDGQSSFIVGTQ